MGSTSNDTGGKVFVLSGMALVVAGVWTLVTGGIGHWVPIGFAIYTSFKVARAVNRR